MENDTNGTYGNGATPGPSSGRARVPVPPPPSVSGRASVGGPGASGRASVGPASVGSAAVGSASVGSASVGSASVPAAVGAASVGRASVGRASLGGPDEQPPLAEKSGKSPSSTARAKKRRRRNIIIASIAAFIMISGIGIVAGTYYFDNVALPDDITLDQSTTIYYSDGTTPMGRIGENRTVLPLDKIPKDVQHAVVAAEDNSFYTNDGVDYKGVVRAAWNNVSGGDRQGASTISQQYARHWADLEGVTYARKLREAVIALKLNQQYSKDEIMAMYLNIVYFGRGAYGIEAAAQAYFAKPAEQLNMAEGMVLAGLIKNPEGSGKGSPFDPNVDKQQAHDRFDYIKGQMLKLNFCSEADAPTKMKYPDKVITRDEARTRTSQSQNLSKPEGLIIHHVLGEVASIVDPKTGGLLYEDTDDNGKKNFDKILNGGLKIVTTIDKDLQPIAVREGSSQSKESNMYGQQPNLQAALAAVEPGSGGVKAYYGGDNGNGNDYAGYYNDPVQGGGKDSCCGGHPPGSTFKVYTLATALIAGYRADSMWDGAPHDIGNRTEKNKNQVKNATEGVNPDCISGDPHWCTLTEITVQSLNVPFYSMTFNELGGAAKVIDTARAAGITDMWATVKDQPQPVRIDLTKQTGADVSPKYFDTEVAFGQYPITVLEHAGGLATFAAKGVAVKTHFLKEVWKNNQKTYAEVIKPQRIPGFTDQMADDMTNILKGVPEHYGLTNGQGISPKGYSLAGKTGTWQYGATTSKGNAHAWMGGFAPYDPGKKSAGLAAAVWVGNKAEEQAIKFKNGTNIIGGKLPGPIWRDFMDAALAKVNTPKLKFPPPRGTGNKEVGDGVSPQPSVPPVNPLDPNPGQSNPPPGPGTSPQPSQSRRR